MQESDQQLNVIIETDNVIQGKPEKMFEEPLCIELTPASEYKNDNNLQQNINQTISQMIQLNIF